MGTAGRGRLHLAEDVRAICTAPVAAMQRFVEPGERAHEAAFVARVDVVDQLLGAALDELQGAADAEDEDGEPDGPKQ